MDEQNTVTQEITLEDIYSADMSATPKKPTLGDRLTTVESEIANLSGQISSLSNTTFGKAWSRGEKLTLAGVVIAVAIGFFGWWKPHQEQHDKNDLTHLIDDEVENKLKEHHIDQLVTDVAEMKGQLGEISGFLKVVAEREMKRIADLPLNDFEKNLSTVKEALSIGKLHNATVPPQTVSAIQERIISIDHQNPEFWPTASAMVDFRSTVLTDSLPACLSEDPKGTLAKSITATDTSIPINPPKYVSCQANFDSASEQSVYLKKLNSFGAVIFDHCRITYHGTLIGPIQRSGTMTFVQCQFNMELQSPPLSIAGQRIINGLLSSADIDNASVSFSPS